ncbi:hypothetical protein A2U01_0070001 [Trifolium medium]|uniref:Uncharacterized protein n=1 Tax=Trifolium medium TaxID=97028 RepID=A0A392SIN0_9FABA|nr:hypothetical protein [Trifolium medium]
MDGVRHSLRACEAVAPGCGVRRCHGGREARAGSINAVVFFLQP